MRRPRSGLPYVMRFIHRRWPPAFVHGIVDAMVSRFTTIVAALALGLTLGACTGTQHNGTPPTNSDTESIGSPSEPGPSDTDAPNATDSSEMEIPNPTLHVVWGTDISTLETASGTTPIGTGTTLEASDPADLVIAVPRDGTVQARLGSYDASVIVTRDDRAALIVEPPQDSNPAISWKWEVYQTDDLFVLEPQRTSVLPDQKSTNLSVMLAETAVERADWTSTPEGDRLLITPGIWARTGSMNVQQYGWDTVVAQVPQVSEYAGDSLKNQFICHAIGALDKDTWNLEVWREDVGLIAFLAARCNPE